MAEPGSLQVGDRVRFVGYDEADYGRGPLVEGTVTKVVPAQGGCMVLPDGYSRPGGFGWTELTLVSRPSPLTCWDFLDMKSR